MGGRGSAGGGTKTAGGVEGQITDAVHDLETRPGSWVAIADVRDRLEGKGLTRDRVDNALESLALKPGVHVIPWDNFKALTPRDRSAAFRLGGQDNHAIRIDPK